MVRLMAHRKMPTAWNKNLQSGRFSSLQGGLKFAPKTLKNINTPGDCLFWWELYKKFGRLAENLRGLHGRYIDKIPRTWKITI